MRTDRLLTVCLLLQQGMHPCCSRGECNLDALSPPQEQNDTRLWKHYLRRFATQCGRQLNENYEKSRIFQLHMSPYGHYNSPLHRPDALHIYLLANEVWIKVIFLHVGVIFSQGEGFSITETPWTGTPTTCQDGDPLAVQSLPTKTEIPTRTKTLHQDRDLPPAQRPHYRNPPSSGQRPQDRNPRHQDRDPRTETPSSGQRPQDRDPPPYQDRDPHLAIAAGSTYPTGMHTCLSSNSSSVSHGNYLF